MISRGRRRSFQRRVLAWYAAHGPDLPWRKTPDPYAILLSEVLSHQTQISRVVPVYDLLLRRYPTAQTMAAAPVEAVKAITDPQPGADGSRRHGLPGPEPALYDLPGTARLPVARRVKRCGRRAVLPA
jgi:hypothetical protein